MLIYSMSIDNLFKIISVAGAHSNIGKTTLCSILLRELKGFAGIKFTKTPVYSSIIEDINLLKQHGKDTAIFLESGAERVLWVRSPYGELENVLEIAKSRVADLSGVIVEGNSPVDFLNPHLLVFIAGTEGEIKPSAIAIRDKADAIIINSEKQADKNGFPSEVFQGKAKVFRIDLIKKKGEIKEFLTFVKEKIGRDAH